MGHVVVKFAYPGFVKLAPLAEHRGFPANMVEIWIRNLPQTEEFFLNNAIRYPTTEIKDERLKATGLTAYAEYAEPDEELKRFPSGNRFIGQLPNGQSVFFRCYAMGDGRYCHNHTFYNEGVVGDSYNVFLGTRFHYELLPHWQDIYAKAFEIVDDYRLDR